MTVTIATQWNYLLKAFAPYQTDVYYTEEYIRLNCLAGQQAYCLIATEGDQIFLLPFVRNTVQHDGVTYYDFETAYGYGGAIANTEDTSFIHSAWDAAFAHFKANGYICGFVRFHPLLKNYVHVPDTIRTIYDRHTVAVNLQPDIDDIWMHQIQTGNRSDILRAGRRGLTFRLADMQEGIEIFRSIYDTTMDRLHADSFYYFTDAYFVDMQKALPNMCIGIVDYQSEPVAAAIFMHNGYYSHYHLSGSKREFQRLCPNNFMLWNAIQLMKEQGCRYLHLGGGTDGNEENPLYRFKQKFSTDRYDFVIGKLIFNPEVYESVCAAWEEANPEKKETYKRLLLKYHY